MYAVKQITSAEILKKAIQKLASFVLTSESTKKRDTIEVKAVSTPKIITEERMSEKFVAMNVGWYVRKKSLRMIKKNLRKLYLRINFASAYVNG
jgi:hypothetical protein